MSLNMDAKFVEENEKYMKAHPEIQVILMLLKIDVLRNKPEDIAKFAAKSFFNSKNRSRIESTIRQKL